jgi:hypothetical protein
MWRMLAGGATWQLTSTCMDVALSSRLFVFYKVRSWRLAEDFLPWKHADMEEERMSTVDRKSAIIMAVEGHRGRRTLASPARQNLGSSDRRR